MGDNVELQQLIDEIERNLLGKLLVVSEDPHEPVVVKKIPKPWRLIGAGNYAAVLAHAEYPDRVVKVYAPGRPGLEEEAEVYRRLGRHPAYSECLHYGLRYLVLRRLSGITLYDCIRRGIPIPRQVIEDIDDALAYAASKGLNPHDVHGKNVMLKDGRGIVVDVSDFLKPDRCTMWDDLKKAYRLLYIPPLRRLPVPDFMLNAIRKGYRFFKKR
ncbi:serine/threonine protein kinase [Paenibacillus allorhizosphaerae]|uniref:Serine/threonine protein kinase n=1 Tax=Paenibacillus allorhizosphaerae TaxID=2849866 RepID=A0ABM8VPT8_9BACL|nr:serine/threonine protein kinase [Paenibacillus allorhizosphaerae]CAG7653232.1 hypothetical protein PAECIP111802_05434 [Paenibacillus allorhizosphaerae]